MIKGNSQGTRIAFIGAGGIGGGTAYKLVVNLMVGVQAVAPAEGLLTEILHEPDNDVILSEAPTPTPLPIP